MLLNHRSLAALALLLGLPLTGHAGVPPTEIYILSHLPNPSTPTQPLQVRVRVQFNPTDPVDGNVVAGDYVQVFDGFTESCRIAWDDSSVTDGIGECTLHPRRAGERFLNAFYFGVGLLPDSNTSSLATQQINGLRILPSSPNPSISGQPIALVAESTGGFSTDLRLGDSIDFCTVLGFKPICALIPTRIGTYAFGPYTLDSPPVHGPTVGHTITNRPWPQIGSVGDNGTVLGVNGGREDSAAGRAALSGDGRWVVLTSTSRNLVASDNNGVADVFVFDRNTGAMERVSVSSTGVEANGPSFAPTISDDGFHVAFHSAATNLTTDPDTNGVTDVLVKNRYTGEIFRVRTASGGEPALASRNAALSGQGRYVAFESDDPAMSADPDCASPGQTQIYVYDRLGSAADLQCVSHDDGVAPNGSSFRPAIDDLGQYIVFESLASNLVAGDINGLTDVFWVNRLVQNPALVSLNLAGPAPANGPSSFADISPDGTRVAFQSTASNFVSDDTNGAVSDIFVTVVETSTGSPSGIAMYSRDEAGDPVSGPSFAPSLSNDYVAFESDDETLVTGDSNGLRDVFRVQWAGSIVRISTNSEFGVDGSSRRASVAANTGDVGFDSSSYEFQSVIDDNGAVRDVFIGYFEFGGGSGIRGLPILMHQRAARLIANQISHDSMMPAIDNDGTRVVFLSAGQNVDDQRNLHVDAFVRDRSEPETLLLSRATDFGPQATLPTTAVDTAGTADRAAFATEAVLVASDTNVVSDIYLRDYTDTNAPVTALVSANGSGTVGNGASRQPVVNADGLQVAFASLATNLVAGDTNGFEDVFVKDTAAGTVELISVAPGSVPGNRASFEPRINGDFVSFTSLASDLVAGDTNATRDVFRRNRVLGTTARASISTGGVEGNGASQHSDVSLDGTIVVYESVATNLVSADTNGVSDIFIRDFTSATTIRIEAPGGIQPNSASRRPRVSDDGRYVVFESDASNLVAGDSNGVSDVFVYDRIGGAVARISVGPLIVQLLHPSSEPAISGDGRVIAYTSADDRAADGDDNGHGDVFLNANPLLGATTTLVIDTVSPATAQVNQPYTVSMTLTSTAVLGGGTITVSDDSGEQCQAVFVSASTSVNVSCGLSSNQAGTRTLIAQFPGNAANAPAQSGPATVEIISAPVDALVVTGDSPDPSRIERAVLISFELTPTPFEPARQAVPTGTVTVKEADNCADPPIEPQHQCTVNLPGRGCQIAFVSIGTKTLQVCYPGDGNFAPASTTEEHEVIIAPVPVSLSAVDSKRIDAKTVKVRWQTAAVVGSIGFDLAVAATDGLSASRAADGTALIAVPRSTVISAGDGVRAQAYEVTADLPGERYWIRSIEPDGRLIAEGPFAVGTRYGADAEVDPAPTRPEAAGDVQRRLERTRALIAASPTATSLHVSRTGIQRLSYEELLASGAAGFAGVAVRELALTLAGIGVPRRIDSVDELFGPGDVLWFHGDAVSDSLYTTTRPYTLQRNPALVRNWADVGAGARANDSYNELGRVTRVAPNAVYSFASPSGDPWAWARVAASAGQPASSTLNFDLADLGTGAQRLSIELWGGVDYDGAGFDHRAQLSINGVPLPTARFDGVRVYRVHADLPAGVLLANGNRFELRVPGDTGFSADVVFLEGLSVMGAKNLARSAEFTLGPDQPNDAIFGSSAETTERCAGCTAFVIGRPSVDTALVLRQGEARRVRLAGSELRYPAQRGDRIVVIEPGQFQRPLIQPLSPAVSLEPASLVIVSPGEYAAELESYRAARTSAGYTARIVEVEQIYARYSQGIVDSLAVRAFLADQSALGTRYVLLVGDDNTDPLGHLGNARASQVPTIYAATGPLVRYAPADPALADFGGDGVADLAIGRWPVRTLAELRLIRDQSLRFATHQDRRALLLAGATEPGLPFELISNQLSATLPAPWQATVLGLDQTSTAVVRDALRAAVVRGDRLIHYYGHSSPNRWGRDTLLSAAEVAGGFFGAGGPGSVFVQWGCWNHYFVDPRGGTLGQTLLTTPGVAALSIGAGTLSEATRDELLAAQLLPRLDGSRTLGDALLQAKRQVAVDRPGLTDLQYGIGLFGDPTLRP